MGIILYELAGEDPSLRFSPYCWRTRLALAHKGLEVETIPWRFTEKDVIAPPVQGRVPVIVDGGRWISDSWAIATDLELTYPDNPTLFSGMAGLALSRLYSAHADMLVGTIFPFIALDIFANLHEKDSQYFRSSREARVGKPLEAFVAGRQDQLAPPGKPCAFPSGAQDPTFLWRRAAAVCGLRSVQTISVGSMYELVRTS
jgi:glutathione S-transferase